MNPLIKSNRRGVKVAKASIVNILEDTLEEIELKQREEFSIPLSFRAFEIKTIKLVLAQ